jgi:hypothetical protein
MAAPQKMLTPNRKFSKNPTAKNWVPKREMLKIMDNMVEARCALEL